MVSIYTYWNTGLKCTSGNWTAPPYWASNTSYTNEWGEGVKPSTSNGHNYLCTHAGTSGSSDPFDSSDKNWDVISDGTVQWTCFDPFTNPTAITGQPFGHGFVGSLWYLYYSCNNDPDVTDDIDSTYLSGRTYDVSSFSSQHEVASVRYRIFSEGDLTDGKTYTIKETWKKAGSIIYYYEHDIVWEWGADGWYQNNGNTGWTPCWRWSFGSKYTGYEEITENGSDYLLQYELYDGSTLLCSSNDGDNNFTIENLQHTVIYWNSIGDVTGASVGGYFGMKASENVHDLWSDTWSTEWYRQKNKSNHDNMKVDGMEQTTSTVELYVFRSGYVKSGRACPNVTDKDINNGPYDFTVPYHLQASVVGYVQEGTDHVPNANVWGERSGAKYGCKTNADGMFALPLHTGGTYTIKAAKNNHDVVTNGTTVDQTGVHPDTVENRGFTLPRTTDYPQGEHAHLNSLAVDGQSVIIIDDPVTGDGDLIIT